MKKIVLLRHGESAWNKENRFTGWTDVDLPRRNPTAACSNCWRCRWVMRERPSTGPGRETFSLLNTEHFLKAIDYLGQADRICFFGVGASLLTALKATNKFLRIEPKVYCMQDSHMHTIGQ